VAGLAIVTLLTNALWTQQVGPGGYSVETFVPQLSDDVLFNPRMGLYLFYPPQDARPEEWFMQIADIVYFRPDWAELNPEEGVYRFDEWYGPIHDLWVKKHGKRVAFRIMSQSMHSKGRYVTPKWVFDKGVPGVAHINLYGEEQIDPVFWDERYLDVHCEFIRRLGEYFDGRPELEFVDIGSIGEWGEMHLARWTPEQLEETGYSESRYVAAYRRVIDAFAAAFPRTQVFLNVGGPERLTIMDYAAQRGIHFRQDGLTPSGASYDVGEWLYKPYSRRGVVCNFEFHSGLEEMRQKGWDLRATIEKGLSAPISYLNTNLGYYRTLPEEARELLAQAARRIGYRFVLGRLDYLPRFRLDGTRPGRVLLTSVWRNDGVAPCYDSLAVEWSLLDAQGKTVATQLDFPPNPTTRWWPGEEQTLRSVMRVPASTPPGEYRLAVRMLLPETGQHIFLGIAGRDEQDRYLLCPIAGVRAEAAGAVAYEEDFEGGQTPWGAVEGITVALGPPGHSGQASLLIAGTRQQGWNYAYLRLPATIPPASKVRLTAWMLVEEIEPRSHPPYIKIGANRADGRWIENYNTNKYDLSRMGTWQPLQGIFEISPEAASFDLCVETGTYEVPITVRLRIDDVKIEVLEAP